MSGRLRTGNAYTFRQHAHADSHQITPSSGHIRIQRDVDNRYWDGSAWVTAETWVSTTVDASRKEHRYVFTPSTSLTGRILSVSMRPNGDAAFVDVREYVVVGGDKKVRLEP